MKTISIRNYSRGASWVLILYLSMMVSGCTPRPMVLPPEEARVLQTRDFNGTPDEVAKAISKVLQEMHYTLDNVDMDLGILTASRTSELELAPISREVEGESADDFKTGLGTFFIIAGTIAIVGLVFAWIFDVFDDDNDRDSDNDREQPRHSRRSRSHHHDSGISIFGSSSSSSDSGADSYTYLMTINLEETLDNQTRVKLSVQAEHYAGARIVESGPVQDQQFYVDIFNRIYMMIND